MNLKEGFRRVGLLAYGCWIVCWLFCLCIYRPFENAAFWQRNGPQTA